MSELKQQRHYQRSANVPGLVLGRGIVSGFERHFHLDYHFGIVTRGAQRQRFQQQNVLLGAHAISCMPPGEMHDGKAEYGALYELITFRLDAACWQTWTQELYARAPRCEFAPVALCDPALAQRMLQWYQTCVDGQSMPLAVTSEWLAIIDQLARASQPANPSYVVAPPQRLSRRQQVLLRDYMQAHLAQAISLEELASLCGLNRFQFLRAFKQSMGMTPYAWLKCLRLEQACVLLHGVAKGKKRIAEVAQEVGFYDQSHFNRAFRLCYGVAPSAY